MVSLIEISEGTTNERRSVGTTYTWTDEIHVSPIMGRVEMDHECCLRTRFVNPLIHTVQVHTNALSRYVLDQKSCRYEIIPILDNSIKNVRFIRLSTC